MYEVTIVSVKAYQSVSEMNFTMNVTQSLKDTSSLDVENQRVDCRMSSIDVKDIISGKIPEVDYLIVHDKKWDAQDLALAISILASQGWSLQYIWSRGPYHLALYKRR